MLRYSAICLNIIFYLLFRLRLCIKITSIHVYTVNHAASITSIHIFTGRAVIQAQPFFAMILYDCNLKCVSYVYMGKIKYV